MPTVRPLSHPDHRPLPLRPSRQPHPGLQPHRTPTCSSPGGKGFSSQRPGRGAARGARPEPPPDTGRAGAPPASSATRHLRERPKRENVLQPPARTEAERVRCYWCTRLGAVTMRRPRAGRGPSDLRALQEGPLRLCQLHVPSPPLWWWPRRPPEITRREGPLLGAAGGGSTNAAARFGQLSVMGKGDRAQTRRQPWGTVKSGGLG